MSRERYIHVFKRDLQRRHQKETCWQCRGIYRYRRVMLRDVTRYVKRDVHIYIKRSLRRWTADSAEASIDRSSIMRVYLRTPLRCQRVSFVGLFSYTGSGLLCRSLFILSGLLCRSLFILLCRSLFIHVGLLCQISFHTCRSLFIHVGLFSYI